jgi:hypothetical protein
MADNVTVAFTYTGNAESNFTTSEDALIALDGLFGENQPVLSAEVVAGKATRTAEVANSSTFTTTVTWLQASDAAAFWSAGHSFEVTKTAMTDAGWSVEGVLTMLDDSTNRFTF